MSERESDLKFSKMEGAEELESVEKAETRSPDLEFDRKLERKVLWKLDTRCVCMILKIYTCTSI